MTLERACSPARLSCAAAPSTPAKVISFEEVALYQANRDEEYNLNKYIGPRIEPLQLTKFNAMIIQSMLNDIAERVSCDRANKVRRQLIGAFKQILKWQMIMNNPVDVIDTYKHEKPDMQLWTLE